MTVGEPGDRAVRLELPEDARRSRRRSRRSGASRSRRRHAVAPDRRRRVDVAAGRLRPAQLAARGAERVDLAVGRADVDAAVGDRRGRVEVARAWPRRGCAFACQTILPVERVQRVDVARVVADVDAVARRSRRRPSPAPCSLVVQTQLAGAARAAPTRARSSRRRNTVAADDERRRLRRADRPAPEHSARRRPRRRSPRPSASRSACGCTAARSGTPRRRRGGRRAGDAATQRCET